MDPLKVSANGRFLEKIDGTPFFWLGDTAWELFHKLDQKETLHYLSDRAHKKFNLIQAVVLAEKNGLTEENAYGNLPLLKNNKGEYDPSLPDLSSDYSYWDHVDFVIKSAEKLGLFVGLLPTWGDKFNLLWGPGPVIFTPDNALQYGRWIGSRYKDYPNIVWILGGDRNPENDEQMNIIRGMAEGILIGDEGKHLITYHPRGPYASSTYFHNESWLDFNMFQSGHFSYDAANYEFALHDYNLTPTKPTMDGEPRYEDISFSSDGIDYFFDDYDARQAAYWSVFAGSCGHTYGHNSIWSMKKNSEGTIEQDINWDVALERPGGNQMQYLIQLMESRPFYEGKPAQDVIITADSNADHVQALVGQDFVFIYIPTGKEVTLKMGKISGNILKAYWYDPRSGEHHFIGEKENTGTRTFQPPSKGRGNDWILVLDDLAKHYSPPGVK